MGERVTITMGCVTAEAELNESETARLVWEALPIEGIVNRWGDEIYFAIPVNAELEKEARDVVEMGEVGYWPMGQAFCIFFGPTPASQGDEIRAYSPITVLGRIMGNAGAFGGVLDGDQIRLERLEE